MPPLRNIGIAAHVNAGKTTLSERILYYTGASAMLGEVDDGTAATDWMRQEQERGITITAAAIRCAWRGCAINLIDTPGHVDFTVEVERSLRVLDGVVAVFSAVEGVESQSEMVWRQADRHGVPRLAFINKMDREGADFDRVVEAVRERLEANAIPFQIPWFEGEVFAGVVDLIREVALRFDPKTRGRTVLASPVPEALQIEVELARELLLNEVLQDEAVIESYLETGDVEVEIALREARRAVIAGRVVPVLCGAAKRNVGVQPVLDAVVDLLPAPGDRPAPQGMPEGGPVALAFKVQSLRSWGRLVYVRVYQGTIAEGDLLLNARTGEMERVERVAWLCADDVERAPELAVGDIGAVIGATATGTGDTLCDPEYPFALEPMTFPEPVIFVALELEDLDDEAALLRALKGFVSEDPTLVWSRNEETGQILLSGMGELHLEIICERLRVEAELAVQASQPRVAYRETISKTAEGVGTFRRRVGVRAHYGQIAALLEPLPPGSGLRWGEPAGISGISREFLEAARHGARKCLRAGALAGYPVADLRVTITDSDSHEVDSSESAFESAGALAIKQALSRAEPVLLEPVMKVEIMTPGEYTGPVIADLNARRANITGMSTLNRQQVLQTQVPLANLFGYATDLRSMTQGRATCSIHFSHYSPLPSSLTTELIAQAKRT